MNKVGIRKLRQNASRVVASAAAGDIITITDRGRVVARMTPANVSSLQELIDAGLAQPARTSLHELSAPDPGAELSPSLHRARAVLDGLILIG